MILSAGLFLGMVQTPLLAQSNETIPDTSRFNGKYFGKVLLDFGSIVTSPFRWKGKDLLLFGAAAGGTALVFAFDKQIEEWAQKHEKTATTPGWLFITRFGEGGILLGLMGVMYIGGEIFSDGSLRKTALLSLESFAISGVIVTGLKLTFGRRRPEFGLGGEGANSFRPFTMGNHNHALPSGHAISAFAVASVIAGESDSVVVGALSYSLASLVAISRVRNNEHWASDAVAGSLLGYFIGRAVLSLNRPSTKDKPTLSFAAAPGGVCLSFRF